MRIFELNDGDEHADDTVKPFYNDFAEQNLFGEEFFASTTWGS